MLPLELVLGRLEIHVGKTKNKSFTLNSHIKNNCKMDYKSKWKRKNNESSEDKVVLSSCFGRKKGFLKYKRDCL